MNRVIIFTKHASEKFFLLKRQEMYIKKQQVIEVLTNPEYIDYSRFPLQIAQASLDELLVLAVVYKRVYSNTLIITFYPAKKRQYGKF